MDFTIEVLKLFADEQQHDDLHWRVNDNGDVKFYVLCNDLFDWGSGDSEDVTPESIPTLRQAFADTKAVDGVVGTIQAASLFCARIRQERPQGAAYPKDPRFWPLFDGCGPKREIDFLNPLCHPADRPTAV